MSELLRHTADEDALVIAHVVASDIGWFARSCLKELLEPGTSPHRHVLLSFTTRSSPQIDTGPVRRVHAPSRLPVMRTLALRRQLAEIVLESGARRMILHAWSPAAARWCAPLIDDDHRLVIEVPEGRDAAKVVIWPPTGRLRHIPVYVCPGPRTVETLVHAGVPRLQCIAPPRSLRWQRPSADRTAWLRATLGLVAEDRTVVILPPLTRESGAFEAAWACLLVRQVYPRLRLLVAGGSSEADRIMRLLKSVRHEAMGCLVPPDVSLGDLVALAEVAAYIPHDSEVAPALPAARDAGAHVVTTVRQYSGTDVILCRARSVRDAARAILKALDRPRTRPGSAAAPGGTPGLAGAYEELYKRMARDWRSERASHSPAVTAHAPAGTTAIDSVGARVSAPHVELSA